MCVGGDSGGHGGENSGGHGSFGYIPQPLLGGLSRAGLDRGMGLLPLDTNVPQ